MRDSYAETYSGTQTAASPHPGRAGVWHYEYALFNMNLDRAIQSFSGSLGTGVNVSNIGFPPRLSIRVGRMMDAGRRKLDHLEHGNVCD